MGAVSVSGGCAKDGFRATLDWLGGRFPRYGAWRGRRGSAFLEYAMLAALIGIVGAVGVLFFGEQIRDFFKELGNKTAGVLK